MGWKCGLIYNPHRSAGRLAPNPCRNAALIGTIKEWSTKPNQTIIAIYANPQIGSGSLFELEVSAHQKSCCLLLKSAKLSNIIEGRVQRGVLELNGSTRVHLGPPGSTWVHMGPLGFTWVHLGPPWSTWVHMGPLGSTHQQQ